MGLWFPKNTVVKIDLASNVTITTAAALDTFFSGSTAIQGTMKESSGTEPVADADKIDLHGTDANGFQNQELEEKTPPLTELEFTLILTKDENIEAFIYDAGTAIAGTHTRYRAGKATLRPLAVLFNLDDGTDEINWAGTNMLATAKDFKPTAADGHWEVTFGVKCLAKDWYGPEFKD